MTNYWLSRAEARKLVRRTTVVLMTSWFQPIPDTERPLAPSITWTMQSEEKIYGFMFMDGGKSYWHRVFSEICMKPGYTLTLDFSKSLLAVGSGTISVGECFS